MQLCPKYKSGRVRNYKFRTANTTTEQQNDFDFSEGEKDNRGSALHPILQGFSQNAATPHTHVSGVIIECTLASSQHRNGAFKPT